VEHLSTKFIQSEAKWGSLSFQNFSSPWNNNYTTEQNKISIIIYHLTVMIILQLKYTHIYQHTETECIHITLCSKIFTTHNMLFSATNIFFHKRGGNSFNMCAVLHAIYFQIKLHKKRMLHQPPSHWQIQEHTLTQCAEYWRKSLNTSRLPYYCANLCSMKTKRSNLNFMYSTRYTEQTNSK
jgi:hypothetical protein